MGGDFLNSYVIPTTRDPGPGLGDDIAVTVAIDYSTATAAEGGVEASPTAGNIGNEATRSPAPLKKSLRLAMPFKGWWR